LTFQAISNINASTPSSIFRPSISPLIFRPSITATSTVSSPKFRPSLVLGRQPPQTSPSGNLEPFTDLQDKQPAKDATLTRSISSLPQHLSSSLSVSSSQLYPNNQQTQSESKHFVPVHSYTGLELPTITAKGVQPLLTSLKSFNSRYPVRRYISGDHLYRCTSELSLQPSLPLASPDSVPHNTSPFIGEASNSSHIPLNNQSSFEPRSSSGKFNAKIVDESRPVKIAVVTTFTQDDDFDSEQYSIRLGGYYPSQPNLTQQPENVNFAEPTPHDSDNKPQQPTASKEEARDVTPNKVTVQPSSSPSAPPLPSSPPPVVLSGGVTNKKLIYKEFAAIKPITTSADETFTIITPSDSLPVLSGSSAVKKLPYKLYRAEPFVSVDDDSADEQLYSEAATIPLSPSVEPTQLKYSRSFSESSYQQPSSFRFTSSSESTVPPTQHLFKPSQSFDSIRTSRDSKNFNASHQSELSNENRVKNDEQNSQENLSKPLNAYSDISSRFKSATRFFERKISESDSRNTVQSPRRTDRRRSFLAVSLSNASSPTDMPSINGDSSPTLGIVNQKFFAEDGAGCAQWNPKLLINKLYEVSYNPRKESKLNRFTNMEGHLDVPVDDQNQVVELQKSWTQKYFRTRDGRLQWFVSHFADDTPVGEVLLSGCEVDANRDEGTLSIHGGRDHVKMIVRVPPTSNLFDKWRKAITSHSASSYLDSFVHPVYPPLPHITEKIAIIELGSCSIRAGVLTMEPSLPQTFFPNIALKKEDNSGIIVGADALIPENRQSGELIRPITAPDPTLERYTVDKPALKACFEKCVADLGIDPRRYRVCLLHSFLNMNATLTEVLLAIPQSIPTVLIADILKIVLEELQFSGVAISRQPSLILYSYDVSTGVVVDIGDRLNIVPVIDGIPSTISFRFEINFINCNKINILS
uniref:PH domain-containing protein n=1 Tax=Anisakis simplex TaxID=6269 RepID=A0A0M3KAQ2_ANISI